MPSGGNPGCSSVGSAIRAVEGYDPIANLWSSKALLPSGSRGAGVASVNGKIYFIHGFTNSVYCYDPAGNSWSPKTPAPVAVLARRVTAFGLTSSS